MDDERQESVGDDRNLPPVPRPDDRVAPAMAPMCGAGLAVERAASGARRAPQQRIAPRRVTPAAMRQAPARAPLLQQDYGRRPHRCLQSGK
jgi:hypothetical protein